MTANGSAAVPCLRPAVKDWPPRAREGRGRAEPPPPHRGQRRPARARLRRSLGPGRSGRWREVRRGLPASPPLPQPLAPARRGPFLSPLRAAWARPAPPPPPSPSPQEAPLFPDTPSRRPGARSTGPAAPAFPRVAGAGLARASFPWEPQLRRARPGLSLSRGSAGGAGASPGSAVGGPGLVPARLTRVPGERGGGTGVFPCPIPPPEADRNESKANGLRLRSP